MGSKKCGKLLLQEMVPGNRCASCQIPQWHPWKRTSTVRGLSRVLCGQRRTRGLREAVSSTSIPEGVGKRHLHP